jgi:hypothetical protein
MPAFSEYAGQTEAFYNMSELKYISAVMIKKITGKILFNIAMAIC